MVFVWCCFRVQERLLLKSRHRKSGEYPHLNPYYAVLPADAPEDSPARILCNWLRSEEGKYLLTLEGYVPVT